VAGLGALASGAFAAVRKTFSFRLMANYPDLRFFSSSDSDPDAHHI
jgi:hypothetical protein